MEQTKTATQEIKLVPVYDVRPSPENDKLYGPISREDPEIQELGRSIQAHGVMEPLVITTDCYVLSGHRRLAAARMVGLAEVPCRIEPIARGYGDLADDPDAYLVVLREHNRQREKTNAERLREEVVSIDPARAYATLKQHRRRAEQGGRFERMAIVGSKRRSEISAAKYPLLNAAIDIINRLERFWPLSVRQIHYQMLNVLPLIHAKKPNSVYANDRKSYQALSDLLTRARLDGSIPIDDAISDETRPVVIYTGYATVRPFMRYQMKQFMSGYYRNLQQSQPNHIEIIAEKNTVLGILQPLASQYCVPLTIGRGYASIPPRREIETRYRESGKARLILLTLSDFDPDGIEIGQSFARSMRDDFGISCIDPVRVALTQTQIADLHLPPSMEAKATSSNYAKFVQANGQQAYELEAVAPERLQEIVRAAIHSALDVEAFNREVEQEQQDAVELEKLRRKMFGQLDLEALNISPEDWGDED